MTRPSQERSPTHAPQVARVDVRTLRAIRAALAPDSSEELRADVDHLIEVAEQAARPL